MITIPEIQAAGGYEVILADPCWQYKRNSANGAAEKHYPTLTVEQLCAIPVAKISAAHSLLFLWGCYPLTPAAMTVMGAWGYQFKTLAFQWIKQTATGKEHFGMGHYTRGNSEPCWLGVKGKPAVLDHAVRQIITTEEIMYAPIGEHSAKPPEARDRIIRLAGDVPRLEMFSRERVTGWDCWGNEVQSDVDLGTP